MTLPPHFLADRQIVLDYFVNLLDDRLHGDGVIVEEIACLLGHGFLGVDTPSIHSERLSEASGLITELMSKIQQSTQTRPLMSTLNFLHCLANAIHTKLVELENTVEPIVGQSQGVSPSDVESTRAGSDSNSTTALCENLAALAIQTIVDPTACHRTQSRLSGRACYHDDRRTFATSSSEEQIIRYICKAICCFLSTIDATLMAIRSTDSLDRFLFDSNSQTTSRISNVRTMLYRVVSGLHGDYSIDDRKVLLTLWTRGLVRLNNDLSVWEESDQSSVFIPTDIIPLPRLADAHRQRLSIVQLANSETASGLLASQYRRHPAEDIAHEQHLRCASDDSQEDG